VVFSPDIDQAFIKQLIKFPNVQFDDRTDSMTALILKFIYQLRQAERQNIKSPDQKSVELPNKNDIPTEKKSISKAQELIDKYK